MRATRLTRVVRGYCPHQPSPKQQEFLELDCEEALYGGAAGGGKSDALLMAALQYVDVPGYAALILRRSYADLALPEAIMARAEGWWLGTDAKWHDKTKTWTFPSGATITFSYLQHEKDKYRYQGAAFQFVGFDELTQFTETQYTYLFSRLRRLKGSAVPIRMRSASNPGGAGHEWVKRRFITSGTAEGRVFVPARRWDNPGLDNEAYTKSLQKLDATTRQQLDDGDWDAVAPGNYFQPNWFKIVDALPAGLRWMRYWDLAGTEENPDGSNDPCWTAGCKMAIRRHPGGASDIFIADMRRTKKSPGGVEEFITLTAKQDTKRVPVRIEQEPGSSGLNTTFNYKSRVLFGWNVDGHKKTGSKEEMWKPLSAQAEVGNVYLLKAEWNDWFIRECCTAPAGHVDGLDAASGCFALLLDDQGAGRTRLLANAS